MKTRDEIIYDGIFDYLDDSRIKEELYSSAYYIIYLVNQLETVDDEFINFSIRHNIIILLGGIIEAILFQYVYKYYKKNNDDKKIKKFCKRYEYKEKSKLIEKSDEEGVGIVYCERIMKFESFKDNINFNFLIKGAKDNQLLNDIIIKKINNFRKVRNGVHLNVLLEIREVFSNSELTEFFKDSKYILREIEEKYKKI